MANAPHKHKAKLIRGVPQKEADTFDAAVTAAGSNRSAVTRQLWAWFAGEGELPLRPTTADTAMVRKLEREAEATEEFKREAARDRRAWAASKRREES